MPYRHQENHRTGRIGWLRASVLGANDGIVSTASLLIGVAAAGASPETLLLTGLAGLVAGAMSMAAGEYVSVRSQADAEAAELAAERREIEADPSAEQRELAAIYVARGVDASLANAVAAQLMAKDALGAHARDELGLTKTLTARPVQAALSSAASFAAGAALPLLAVLLTPQTPVIAGSSLVCLALLGAAAARAGGAPVLSASWRMVFWGALAMAITASAGALFGAG